ncbi:M48 family metalloprotease [Aquabacterium parvum]|uniref:M48 family metalloprotease n=1 Tax=Aquabacterium parvum TaxID=70584 RepID=UPI000718CCB4|nr:M48 family metallopeptidase [Aquabacterium parvum]MBU0915170.1 M48 family metalloprotease [Gammaproteobacteria bacterium]
MEQADFVHHVRVNEYLSAEDPSAYRRRVAWFAGLGYAWIGGCLLVSIWLATWAIQHLASGRARGGTIFLLIGAAGLAWTSLRSLWVRLDAEPEGHRLTKQQAPALFKLISQVRRKVKGPRLDEVWLDDRFNASISQVPRFGLLGRPVNRLTIGLPLLMALDVQRLSAVLAHEYGHLRGNHGRFAAWIYRTRLSWLRMNERLGEDNSISGWLNARFMSWYVPRFLARSFALARQDEYEADRISARLVGAATAGAALVEIDIKGAWMGEHFWRQHWQGATDHALPVGPFKALRHLLLSPPEEGFAREALRRSLKEVSNIDDTHPVLKERLGALKVPANLPDWSSKGALALLGTEAEAWVQRFDQAWCKDQAKAWKAQHQRQQALKQRVEGWRARAETLGTDELVLWARCESRLHSDIDVVKLYQQALERNPAHADALLGLVQACEDAPPALRLSWLDQLWSRSPDHRHFAARKAVTWLERPPRGTEPDAIALKQWRQRVKDAQAADDAVWEALTEPPWFTQLQRHDLDEVQLEDTREVLGWHPAIRQAWLCRRRLPEHSDRRAYLLFVDVPDLNNAQRAGLCQQLIHQLGLPGPAIPLCIGDEVPMAEVKRSAFNPIVG